MKNETYITQENSEFEERVIGLYSGKFQDLSAYSGVSENDKDILIEVQHKLPTDCYGFARNLTGHEPVTSLHIIVVLGPSYESSADINRASRHIRNVSLAHMQPCTVSWILDGIMSSDEFMGYYLGERYTTDNIELIPMYYRLK